MLRQLTVLQVIRKWFRAKHQLYLKNGCFTTGVTLSGFQLWAFHHTKQLRAITDIKSSTGAGSPEWLGMYSRVRRLYWSSYPAEKRASYRERARRLKAGCAKVEDRQR